MEMIKFNKYIDVPMRLKRIDGVWQCEDTHGARYHAKLPEYPLPEVTEHTATVKHEQWPHQQRSFNKMCSYENLYLYMLPGLGKSKVVVDFYNTYKPDLTLIICPKVVIQTWKNQFNEHGKISYDLYPLDNGGSEKKRKIVKMVQKGVIVVNYETVWRIPELLKKEIDLIVFDEAHRLQSPTSSINKFCRKLKAKKKIGMTGTCGEPKKWYGQFLCLDKGVFGTNKKMFLERYFKLDYFGNPTKVKDESIYDAFMSIAHKEIEEIDIPTPTHQTISVPLKCQKEYKELEKTFLLEMEQGLITASNAMVKNLKLRQMCSGFVLDENENYIEFSNEKKKTMIDMLSDMDVPVVIFYNFNSEEAAIRGIAEKLGRDYGNISGKNKDMHKIDNPNGTILAIQIRAGGTGLDGLQKHYHNVFFYSPTWSEIDHEQCIRRVWRAGLKRAPNFYYLITENTVEVDVVRALRAKQNVLEALHEKV